MDSGTPDETITRLEREAVGLAETGCFGRAAEIFGRAVALAPASAHLHESLAQCFLELDRIDEACCAASRAVQCRPEWPEAHATLGRAQRNGGLLQDAADSLARAVRAATDGSDDASAVAEFEAELGEVEALLECHWSEYHDVVVPLRLGAGGVSGAVDVVVRLRQSLDCRHCRLGAQQGPGGAVWAAGVVLAQYITSCNPDVLKDVPTCEGRAMLELGSGTGVGGLAAAACGADVLLTDLEPLLPGLQRNVALNAAGMSSAGGRAEVATFDWFAPPPAALSQCPWDLVLAADLVYSFASVQPFARTLAAILRYHAELGTAKRLSVIYAHNPRSTELDAEMHAALTEHGLHVSMLPPLQVLKPVGRISLASLRRVVMFRISAGDPVSPPVPSSVQI